MAKVVERVLRRDSMQDHDHAMPDGRRTAGELKKPARGLGDPHTHLYEFEGTVFETGLANNEPGHVHVTEVGDTSGPSPVAHGRSDAIDEPREVYGYIQRRGAKWVAVSSSGAVLASRDRMDDAQGVLEQMGEAPPKERAS